MASGILLRFRRAPLHVLVNLLYSAFCVAWLVYRVLLGFSFVFRRGFFSKSVFLAVSLRFYSLQVQFGYQYSLFW